MIRVPEAVLKDIVAHARTSPEAQLQAMREMAAMDLDLLGTYHSHPRTPAIPSLRDTNLAAYPNLAHVILSLAVPQPEIRRYRITAEEVSILELAVEQATPKGDRPPTLPNIVGFCALCDTECSSLLQAA